MLHKFFQKIEKTEILCNWLHDAFLNNPAIKILNWSSRRGQWLTSPTRSHEVVGSVPGLAQWVKDLVLP